MNVNAMEFSLVENVLAVCFGLCIAAYMIWLLGRAWKKRGSRTVKVEKARILSKFEADYCSQTVFAQSGQVESGLAEKGKLYKLLLENEEKKGQKYELVTSRSVYDRVKEGDIGELVFCGEELVQFGELSSAAGEGNSFVGANQDFES